jgi:hypothetical protein
MSRRPKPHGPVAVDVEDQHLLARSPWHRDSHGYLAGSRVVGSTRLKLHRLIAGAQRGEMVDHINGDILDNRRCNLRVCSNRQNQQNRRFQMKNETGYKGVVFDRRSAGYARPFYARITVDGKMRHVGSYTTAEEAARAYDRAALQHFGTFAATNFAPEVANG